jgi:hypothetical protein
MLVIRAKQARKTERSSISVPTGEPHQAQRKSATDELTPNAEGITPSAFGVFAYFSRDFAYPRISAELSGSGEIIRGASVTHRVTTVPRPSRGKTLALSRRDSKRVNNTVPTAPRTRSRTSRIRLTIFVISSLDRVITDREIDFRLPACRSPGEGRWDSSTEMSHATARTHRRLQPRTTFPAHRRSPGHRPASAPSPFRTAERPEKPTGIISEWP